ncbi:MAG: pyridoxal-phosphate dependent enzyme [Clostridia bacterium]|nr:pyridoxal-phosphate dependent enzyme [Clostridia bacterium]
MESQKKNTKQNTVIEKLLCSFNQNEIFVKREDLLPFSFGGNKARKAKKFFDYIIKNKYEIVATYGSSSSNHCRVVANLAFKYGIECYIVSPEEEYKETSNSKMIELFGAKIIKAPLDKIKETIDCLMEKLTKNKKAYFIQGGGHGNLGTEAYVEVYNEILDYEKENKVKFDYIFLASGTGTTQAGLACGAILNGEDSEKIIGISIARKNPRGKAVVEESIKDYLESISYNSKVPSVIFDDSYICGGYGKYNDQIVGIIKEVISKEGMPLNTIYTGKAFWGMREYLQKHKIIGKRVLFINTGGTPLFFDDLKEIK